MKNCNKSDVKKKRPREDDTHVYTKRNKIETYSIITHTGPGQTVEEKYHVYTETF